MKPSSILITLSILLVLSCDRTPTDSAGDKLYLHWFAVGSEQEFIPLQSSEVHLGEQIKSEGLNGKILRDSRGLHATLEGHYGLSTGDFRNYVEPDEIFGPAAYSYSGVIHTTYFVVSSHPEAMAFYNELRQRKPVEPSDDSSFEIDLDLPLFVDPEPEA
jgi:hypothetical protein